MMFNNISIGSDARIKTISPPINHLLTTLCVDPMNCTKPKTKRFNMMCCFVAVNFYINF